MLDILYSPAKWKLPLSFSLMASLFPFFFSPEQNIETEVTKKHKDATRGGKGTRGEKFHGRAAVLSAPIDYTQGKSGDPARRAKTFQKKDYPMHSIRHSAVARSSAHA